MKIALIGGGKMGRMLESLCQKDEGLTALGFVGPEGVERLSDLPDAEIAIDFSYPGGLDAALNDAIAMNIPLVEGTTGLSAQQEAQIAEAAKLIPIVRAQNFSTGVTVLCRLVREAARALGEDFDVELVETHHNQKVDAPSGTAKLLLSAVDPENAQEKIYGREGVCPRKPREIGVHALRGGTVAGEHSVKFFGGMEEIELRHRADSREIFARGALKAAQFAMSAKPGLYNMEDVLFGK